MSAELRVAAERWPIAGAFRISRGARTEAHVVVAEIADGAHKGRGECVPYARYGETVAGVVAALEALGPGIARGLDRAELQEALPAGAARNALDCALWDLEAKRKRTSAATLAGVGPLAPVPTCYTISLGAPDEMAAAAAAAGERPLLKLKLGGGAEDLARVRAVREAAPSARLVVDANEAWSLEDLATLDRPLAELGVELIEQPLPAGEDAALGETRTRTPLCADESVHDRASLEGLPRAYAHVNVKLDKTGGLTEALAMSAEARARGLGLFVGCMVATSLAMAPAFLLTPGAAFVDLDGPLLLARDRDGAIAYEGGMMAPPGRDLWG